MDGEGRRAMREGRRCELLRGTMEVDSMGGDGEKIVN